MLFLFFFSFQQKGKRHEMKKLNLNYKMYEQREKLFYHQPTSYETDFYEIVASGNTEWILENQKKYARTANDVKSEGKGRLSDDPVRNEIYHMVVNTALITRACEKAGLLHEVAYTLSDLYIKQADQCKSIPQVHALNDRMVLDYAARMKKLSRASALTAPVSETVNYIYDHLHIKLSASMLARRIGLSRSYFSTLFKKETSMTVGAFILQARIDTAKNILTHADDKIIEIAATLGFPSQSYFCKRFKELTGVSPALYRKNAHR